MEIVTLAENITDLANTSFSACERIEAKII